MAVDEDVLCCLYHECMHVQHGEGDMTRAVAEVRQPSRAERW
jgi:hypothetical protein